MARTRNWETLGAGTRRRYENAGITRSDYLSGMSLKKARGHQSTPEHPGRKVQPGQEQYFVNEIVERAFSHVFKYVGPLDLDNLPEGIDPPTLDQLEYARGLNEMQLWKLAHEPDWKWLYYHGFQ